MCIFFFSGLAAMRIVFKPAPKQGKDKKKARSAEIFSTSLFYRFCKLAAQGTTSLTKERALQGASLMKPLLGSNSYFLPPCRNSQTGIFPRACGLLERQLKIQGKGVNTPNCQYGEEL